MQRDVPPSPHLADPRASRPTTRRQFLTGLSGVAGLTFATTAVAACGGDGGGPDRAARASTSTIAGSGPSTGFVLLQNFPSSGYLVAGSPQRLPFLIAGSDGAPLDSIDGPVELVLRRDGVGDPVTTVMCEPKSVGLPRAYLPMELTFDQPGQYVVSGTYKGSAIDAALDVGAAGSTKLPQRGGTLPPVDTPTVADPRGVDPICTRDPACPLHTVNLAESLAAGRPVAVLVSTPAYCQTAICGPVLDLFVAAAAEAKGVDLIHCEVYANPLAVESIAEATSAPIVAAYDMPFEPILFVVDGRGTLTERFDSIFDRDQLSDALSTALP